MVGGDGSFILLANAMYTHPDKNMIKVPVCAMPGGSGNGTACATKGRQPEYAMTNLLRGKTVATDMIDVQLVS